ncbi:glutamate-rich protein 1 isoform X1 [Salvelinus sp. IW2-2015]|uniref:glutamate-rich protein 1 isoform X1 n=1 Tax=Salvelinus sp. IW2-2015 TaxID=2691554 RepID=UPI000CDF9039|nr:glutamate-rich protein 1 isoform X1 [Salvelinus alpinus]
MAHRKEVFQSKVLQRLYPLPPKPEKEPSSSPPEFVLEKSSVKQKVGLEVGTITGDEGIIPSSTQPGRRMYTVVAPPAEYKTGAEGSVTLSQPACINTVEDPADENTHESEGEGERQRLRRKRRKRKGTTAPGGGTVAGQATDSNPGDPTMAPTPTEKEGERLSKNKRRKLKKKRHKEKLLSLGLMPRAAALEFTYQREGNGQEDEDEEMKQRRAAEVMDFLRTTQEIYVSDRSLPAGRLHVSSVVVEGLLTSLSNGTFPPPVLAQLHSLKSLVQQQDTERLAKALQELQNSSTMSPSEATAVVSLFQYWITDILPLQRQKDRPTNNTTFLVEPTNNTA